MNSTESRTTHPPPSPAITARNIRKSFGRNLVLDDISFEAEKGSLIGIEGENGSGKSTLLNILAGFWHADKGILGINGSTGFCPQEPYLFSNLTVAENLRFFSQAYGLRHNRGTRGNTGQFDELLHIFRFHEPLSKKCSSLSGGTLQKLNLIVSLLHDPDILLLDEPYAAFDWQTYLSFWDYSEKQRNQGKTVVIISHIIYDREKLDRIFTLEKGRFI